MPGLGALCERVLARLEGRMFLAPWIRERCHQQRIRTFAGFFSPPFFIVATSYGQEKSENIVLPPRTNGVNHQLFTAARAAARAERALERNAGG